MNTNTSTIFYKKVGRKYVAVSQYDREAMDAMPNGHHLISVYIGGASTRYNIDPNYAALIAAGRVAEDQIADAIRRASDIRPHRQPITEEQRRAWDELCRVFGNERYHIEIPSARECAQAGVKAMMEEANLLMQHNAVRLAFEHFITVCKLCKEEENGS